MRFKLTKKIKDTSSLNQIRAASKEMISCSPIPIELEIRKPYIK